MLGYRHLHQHILHYSTKPLWTSTSPNAKQLNAESDQSPTESNASVSIEPLNHNPLSSIRQTEQNTAQSTDNTLSDQNSPDNIEPTIDEKTWEDVKTKKKKKKAKQNYKRDHKHHRHTGSHGQWGLILQPVSMGSL